MVINEEEKANNLEVDEKPQKVEEEAVEALQDNAEGYKKLTSQNNKLLVKLFRVMF